MRLLEILMLLLLFVCIIFSFIKRFRRPKWTLYLPSANLGLLLLHVLFEGYRLQMFPAYLLMIIFFFTNLKAVLKSHTIVERKSSRMSIILRVVGGIFAFLFFNMAAFLPYNMPVFKLPKPTGKYEIGTQQLSFINNTREETWTKEEGDFPNIPARVWYPAKSTKGYKKACYMKSKYIAFDYYKITKSNSYWNTEISDQEEKFPIIIFNHGGGGYNIQNTIQMEEFASHGYIVFSLGHPYESTISNYPDGSYITSNWKQMKPQIKEMIESARVYSKLKHYFGGDTLSLDQKKEIMHEIHKNFPVELTCLRRWANDTQFFLDELQKMNENNKSLLFNKLNLNNIGICGMSFGGATAVHVGMHDKRIKAVINYDGYAYGDVIKDSLQSPVLLFSNEYSAGVNDVVFEQAQKDSYYISIKGAYHANFNDSYLWMKHFRPFFIGKLGKINPERMNTIVNTYSLSFFNKYLKKSDTGLSDIDKTKFPEVTLRKRNI